jgi:hypothetical protein
MGSGECDGQPCARYLVRGFPLLDGIEGPSPSLEILSALVVTISVEILAPDVMMGRREV